MALQVYFVTSLLLDIATVALVGVVKSILDLHNITSSFITALHGMQTRSSDENPVRLSVCLSVCLSNACFVTKWQKGRSTFLYYTKGNLA